MLSNRFVRISFLFALFAISSLYSQTIRLGEGVIAYYRFENNTLDVTGKGHDAVSMLAPVEFVPDRNGNPDKAIILNGKQLLKCTALDLSPEKLPQISIGVWVKPTLKDKKMVLVSNDNSQYGRCLLLDIKNGAWGWCAFAGDKTSIGSVPVDLNEWTLLVVTYDQITEDVTLYVKNSLRNTVITGKGKLPKGLDYTSIGGDPQRPHLGFTGIIDGVRFYNRVLNKEEIDCMYINCTPVTGSTGTPTTHDTTATNHSGDSTGSNNSGSLNGNTGTTTGNITGNNTGILTSQDSLNLLPGKPVSWDHTAGVVCPNKNNEIRFTIPPIKNAESYEWRIPYGTIGKSVDNKILIKLLAPIAAGYIAVRGINKYGAGEWEEYLFTLKSDDCPPIKRRYQRLPGMPGKITLLTPNACGTIGSQITFSVEEAENADEYEWLLPSSVTGESKTNTITVTVIKPITESVISVRGVNDYGCGRISWKIFNLKPGPVLASPNFTIDGPVKICADEKFYIYKYDHAIINADTLIWKVPEHSKIIKQPSPKEIHVFFDPKFFTSGYIELFGQNKCGNSDTVKLKVEYAGVRIDTLKTSGPSKVIVNRTGIFSVHNSFKNAEFYQWKTSSDVKNNSKIYSTEAGYQYENNVELKFLKGNKKERIVVWGWNKKCGFSKDSIVFNVDVGEVKEKTFKSVKFDLFAPVKMVTTNKLPNGQTTGSTDANVFQESFSTQTGRIDISPSAVNELIQSGNSFSVNFENNTGNEKFPERVTVSVYFEISPKKDKLINFKVVYNMITTDIVNQTITNYSYDIADVPLKVSGELISTIDTKVGYLIKTLSYSTITTRKSDGAVFEKKAESINTNSTSLPVFFFNLVID